jgi:REP element-mobilizing transposase RayT
MSLRIPETEKDRIYFLTFTIKNWYYLFDRHNRFQILEESFVYCQKNKNLRVHAFVFMLNHIHFIGSAPNMIEIVRDMKKFLSKQLKKNIIETEPRILKLFQKEEICSFWQKGNAPKQILSESFLEQKINYIHANPVKKGYVNFPEDWRWSSLSKIPTNIHVSTIQETL